MFVFSFEHKYGGSDGVLCHILVIIIMLGVGILLISHLIHVWLTLDQ